MKTIVLMGDLGKTFGTKHRFAVRSAAEAVRALIANFPAFETYLVDSKRSHIVYKVLVGSQAITANQIPDPIGREETITIAPEIAGAKAGIPQFVTGAILVAAAIVAAPFTAGTSLAFVPTALGLAAFSTAISGVRNILNPTPPSGEPPEPPDSKPNYNFNGPVNTSAQGQPVPIGYGRLIIGSAVVSAGITSEEL